ncbi:MAG: esterase/lipase family protein, partial [Gammaproteobacteria bacterium]
EAVVLIHGLFLNGYEMSFLRFQLSRAGYLPRRFRYLSVRCSPASVAEQLRRVVQDLDAGRIHFLCHSLGGLVIRHYFALFEDLRHGRIVTLGTPHQGSGVARYLSTFTLGQTLLGKSNRRGVSGDVPAWNGACALGSIAGTRSMGLGRMITELSKPNDGTVAVAETHLHGAKDHIALPVSHLGMLVSRQVAIQVVHFLQQGRFAHTPRI